jgi:hypothetical protein
MECSQAVLMLMLLVPCEQSGGKAPETVIAEELKPAPVVQVDPLPGPSADPALSATSQAKGAEYLRSLAREEAPAKCRPACAPTALLPE